MELHDSGKQLVSVCSVGKRLTGLGVEVLMHEGMDDKFLNVGKGRGSGMMLQGPGMFLLLLCLYLQWHEKEMHVSEMMREWKEKKKSLRDKERMFSPYL